MTFASAFQKWLAANDAGMSAGSRSAYDYAVRRFDAFLKYRRLGLEDVRKAHIAAYMAEATEEIKGWTVMGQVKLLKRIFAWAADEGMIDYNPVDLKGLPKLVRHRADRVAFTAEQFAAIMEHCASGKPYWRLACAVSWHTGLRMVDVANLRWDSVDLKARLLTVFPVKLERFAQRLEIPISDDLFDLLCLRKAEMEEESEYVHVEMMMAYKYGRTRLVEQFTALRERAGLDAGSFHSFRHAFITRLVNAGVDTVLIASMTGQSLKQLAEYAHVSNDAKVRALAQGNTLPVPSGEQTCTHLRF